MKTRPFGPAIRQGAVSLLLTWVELASSSGVWAGAWEGYGRSVPRPRYEQDEGANPNHRFGVREAFTPYRDPDRSEAESLPDPLRDPAFASYRLIVIVNKTDSAFWGKGQTLRVYRRGEGLLYYWLISTGLPGFETPSGYFIPQGFSSRHWSGPYDAPMLWSVFFNGGVSLHSSLDRDALYKLGRAADSHGCVHIEDHRAEELYHLIGQSGYGLIDQIGRHTGRPVRAGNAPKKISGYRTLIIVAPTAHYSQAGETSDSSQPGEPAEPAGAVQAPPETGTRDTPEPPANYLDLF
ncbi:MULTISPECIES: L,D-transpeptidase [unclassified Methylococcus]|uniref:L,D-transpeptidase n=1 Tax=unclassified Methylococcus TaxID=2618889 RepID=UPI003D7EFFE8